MKVKMERTISFLGAGSCAFFLVACGAESNGYQPTVDRVQTRAEIHFDTADGQNMIIVDKPGPTVRSAILTPCEISFEATELVYDLQNPTTLSLNDVIYTKDSALAAPQHLAGVPDELFAIWGSAAQEVDLVSNRVAIEIYTDSLVYSNTCSR